ncbi:hypothetical protein ACX80Z_15835 [Arthrobacter sp. TMT4-20]
MGSLEDAAARVVAQRAEDEAQRRAGQLERDRQLRELREVLSEYLDVVQRRNYRPEKTYRRATARVRPYNHTDGGGGERSYTLTDVEGWVVETRSPGEWDTCAAKGTLATATGDLYEFVAEPLFAPKFIGEKPILSRFYRHERHVRDDLVLILGERQERGAPWYRYTVETLAESLATYTTAGLA